MNEQIFSFPNGKIVRDSLVERGGTNLLFIKTKRGEHVLIINRYGKVKFLGLQDSKTQKKECRNHK